MALAAAVLADQVVLATEARGVPRETDSRVLSDRDVRKSDPGQVLHKVESIRLPRPEKNGPGQLHFWIPPPRWG